MLKMYSTPSVCVPSLRRISSVLTDVSNSPESLLTSSDGGTGTYRTGFPSTGRISLFRLSRSMHSYTFDRGIPDLPESSYPVSGFSPTSAIYALDSYGEKPRPVIIVSIRSVFMDCLSLVTTVVVNIKGDFDSVKGLTYVGIKYFEKSINLQF